MVRRRPVTSHHSRLGRLVDVAARGIALKGEAVGEGQRDVVVDERRPVAPAAHHLLARRVEPPDLHRPLRVDDELAALQKSAGAVKELTDAIGV